MENAVSSVGEPPPTSPTPSPYREIAVQYAMAVACVTSAHIVTATLWPRTGPATFTIFLGSVLIASLYGGYGPGLLATLLASLDIAFSFIPPFHSLVINVDDLLLLATFAFVASVTSFLQSRRRSAESSLRRAHDDLERRVRDRTAELVRSQAKLGQLVNDLLVIAEHEQQRIGHDLHDGLGQELTGISMLSVALADQLKAEISPATIHADQLADLTQNALRHTRDLARGLCPVDLEDEGLATALQHLADRVSRLPGVVCKFHQHGTIALPASAATHLFRIAQEATSNALRHGQARNIGILLTLHGTALALEVTDDGAGFSSDAPSGMGLRLMRHRAETIGAALQIVPSPAGTRVRCELTLS
jgi:signal transduction histidine kinase